MTKAELRAFVQQAVGGISAANVGVTVDDAWYDSRVLDGYRRVVTEQGVSEGPSAVTAAPRRRLIRFRELEDRKTRTLDTSMTSNFMANQSGVLLVLDLFDRTSNVGLANPPESAFSRRDPDELGVPREWTAGSLAEVRGYFIWPYPGVSSDDIDVYETVLLDPTLASDGVSPTITEEWHLAIAYAAVAGGAALLDWAEKAQEFELKLTQYIQKRTTLDERRSLGPRSGVRRNIRVGGFR